jgi:predicted ribosomally synthesized peptide with SipW-like signal peptide
MKNKKFVGLLIAVGLIAAVGIGSTLAYFTSRDNIQNVFTLGNVGISLSETSDEEGAEILETGIEFFDVLPGQTISKKPVVTVNDDSQPCYIRIKLELSAEPVETRVAGITEANMDALEAGLVLGESWKFNAVDGYYYYGKPLNAGVASSNLFDQVIIPSDWGNATAGRTINMDIQAEAVQSGYSDSILVKDAFGNVTGWTLTQTEKDDLGITTP